MFFPNNSSPPDDVATCIDSLVSAIEIGANQSGEILHQAAWSTIEKSHTLENIQKNAAELISNLAAFTQAQQAFAEATSRHQRFDDIALREGTSSI